MNQIFSTICAVVFSATCAWAWPNPCCRAVKTTTCYVPQEECIPRPLKKESCCRDAYRDPYRIVWAQPNVPREYMPFYNTQAAYAMRRAAVVRQKEIIRFEKNLVAATYPIPQAASEVGTTVYGSTEGAGAVHDFCEPIPCPPAYPGPGFLGCCNKVKPAPVGEKMAVTITAEAVPGKPGFVFCPFARSAGYIDVTGLASGSVARDPYTGRLFLIP